MYPGLSIPQAAAHAPLSAVDSPFCSCLPCTAQACSPKPQTITMLRLSIRGQSSLTVFSLYKPKKANRHKPLHRKIAWERTVFAAFGINLGAATDNFLCCWKYKIDFAVRLLSLSSYCSPGPLYPNHIKQPCPILCHHISPSLSLCWQFLKGPQTAWQAATSIWPKHKPGTSSISFPSFILLVLDIVPLDLRAQ